MKFILTQLILLFLLIPIVAQSQNPSVNKAVIEKNDSIVKDTTFIINNYQDKEILKYYQDILEKTNSQLSLWWNPYGVLIGLLGVLFTVLTIIAAVVIYRQSKEYKELIRESITKHETVLGQMITERNQQLKIIETNLNNTINEYKEKLVTATEENKKEFKDLITNLEKQKESIDTQIQANYVVPEEVEQSSTVLSYYGKRRTQHKCSNCGYGYFVQTEKTDFASRREVTLGYSSKTITCPKCGNVERYYSYY